jgi:hypothetical protein
VLLDQEGSKPFFPPDNKVVVFNRDGYSTLAHPRRSLGNSVKTHMMRLRKIDSTAHALQQGVDYHLTSFPNWDSYKNFVPAELNDRIIVSLSQ